MKLIKTSTIKFINEKNDNSNNNNDDDDNDRCKLITLLNSSLHRKSALILAADKLTWRDLWEMIQAVRR